jgi:ribonuclease D
MEHETIFVQSREDLDRFESIIDGQTSVAFDVEGIRLSRTGAPTLATLGIHADGAVVIFLFDLFVKDNVDYYDDQIAILRNVLQDLSVIKIIHDCRNDSDALNEYFGIALRGIMDTSVYDMFIRGSNFRQSLNNTLKSYDCDVNELRDKPKDFYVNNPRYWANRPLSQEQIKCASADVSFLFQLRERILSRSSLDLEVVQAASERAADEFRSLRFLLDIDVPAAQMGLVIGKNRAGIEKIRKETGALVNDYGTGFRILAKDDLTAQLAKKMIVTRFKGRK